MSKKRKVRETTPTVPTELWGLWMDHVRSWVPTFDTNPGHDDPILVFESKAQASSGLKHQKNLYDVDARIVRIK